MAWPEPITLSGKYGTLVPLSHEYLDDLMIAAEEGKLWADPYAAVAKPDAMEKDIAWRLAEQERGVLLPFVVIDNQTQTAVGMTSYCWTDSINKRLDIGRTWYAKRCQRTGLNTECKLMLLTHAFEVLDCIAVGFRVNTFNQASQRAVERLGAKHDGIMRNYSVMPDGNIRDMYLYSIVPQEWPRVKAHLLHLLNKVR